MAMSVEKLTQILGVTSDGVIDELLTNILDNNKQKVFDLLNKLKEHHISYESALKVLSEKIFAISEEQTFGGGNKSIIRYRMRIGAGFSCPRGLFHDR